jgi:hypothetical protein
MINKDKKETLVREGHLILGLNVKCSTVRDRTVDPLQIYKLILI